METVQIIAWLLRLLGAALLTATAMPFVRSGAWPVRVWDFPRIQLAVLAAGVAVGLLLLLPGAPDTIDIVLLGLLALAIVWQLAHTLPYTPLWPRDVPTTTRPGVRILVVNLDVRNQRHADVVAMIRRQSPDLLLLIEIDRAWADALAELRPEYDAHVEDVRPDGRGLALWSRLPLERPRIRSLVSEQRPSIHCRVNPPDGRSLELVGVHPTPPALYDERNGERHDSRIRDAELVLLAREIAAAPHRPWIVIGDFNDVAWSHTIRLFARLSGLVDPRVGRGLFNTYHARYPLLRYPLDHVFVAPGFELRALERIRTPGSDHFAMLAEVRARPVAGPEPDHEPDDHEEAKEIVEEGRADAATAHG